MEHSFLLSVNRKEVGNTMRALAFWFGCLGTRALLAVAAKEGGHVVRRVLAVLSVLIAAGFLVHFVFGTRPTAREAGGAVWWNHARPWHAALHLLFAVHVFAGGTHAAGAWRYLAADVALGAVVWLHGRGMP